MRLAEHADFEQAILRAADHFQARGLRASIIEEDYYVTEALRIMFWCQVGANTDSFLIGVVHVYFLLQHEQQFRTPGALQAFGDFFLAGVNSRITEHSQLQWIALAGHDRPYDRLSGQPAYVADYVGQLYVHLGQGFLHPLNAGRPLTHVFSPLPPIGSKHP